MSNPGMGPTGPDPQRPPNDPDRQSPADQWNALKNHERVQQARQAGKQYSGYFMGALLKPYRTMRNVDGREMNNAAITMGIVAVLSALYYLVLFSKWKMDSVFGPGFVTPLLLTALGLVVAFGAVYLVLRMERIGAAPRTLLAQFGTLLVPAAALLVLSILFLAINLYSLSLTLLLLGYLFVFVAMNTLLYHYPLGQNPGALDTVFAVFLANAVTGYLFYRLIVSAVAGAAMGIFSSFSPF